MEYTPGSVCELVSIGEVSASLQYTISPNPVLNSLTISGFDTGVNDCRVMIINSNGKLVFKQSISGMANSCQVNTSEFASGIYWAKIKSGNDVKTIKFVKAS